MKTNILVTASALSDQDLLARLEMLAGKEREATVELVAPHGPSIVREARQSFGLARSGPSRTIDS